MAEHSCNDVQACHTALAVALRQALDRCEKRYGISAEQTFDRLTDLPPLQLLVPATSLPPNPSLAAAAVLNPILSDRDAQASLLLAEQKLGPYIANAQCAQQKAPPDIENARWTDLTKAEKRAAAKLADFLGKGRSFRRQRPSGIDYPLALYLIFTLEELLGRKAPYSRSPSDDHLNGYPSGPAFDALLAALHLAQWRKAIRAGHPAKSALPSGQAVESIIKVTRSKEFDNLMNLQGLTRAPEYAVACARMLAHVIGLARSRGWSKRVQGTD
jgi:hypothetical protein